MALTWKELITEALLELSVLAEGEAPSEEALPSARRRLQMMLDQWSIEGLLVPEITEYRHTATAEKLEYLIGPGEEIDGEPFEFIIALNYRHSGYQDARPLAATSYLHWSTLKSTVSTHPTRYVYLRDDGPARLLFDSRTLPGDFFEITGRTSFGDLPEDLDTETGLPRGYEQAIVLNLAKELAPSHGVKRSQLAAETLRGADMAKSDLLKRNLGNMEVRFDPSLTQPGRRLWTRS